MSKYRAKFLPSAEKEFSRLEKSAQVQVLRSVGKLEENPRPPGCKKRTGSSAWRIRVGDLRLIYSIIDDILEIEIIKVGQRGSAYR